MNYDFKKCNKSELKDMIQEYVSTLQSPIDSFFEERILSSIFYKINVNEDVIGYFAILNEDLLTQFFLKVPIYSKSREVLEHVLSTHSISSIFVPTSDEYLLSTVLDLDFKMTKQAYFFQDSKIPSKKEKLFAGGELRQAAHSDAERIIEVSQDFFDRLNDRITAGEIFVFMNENHLLGAGIIEKSMLQKGYASVGMFVNEEYRKQGIGRTIIHNLKEWCYKNDLIPICGCWYYNTNSKLTLESAGMVSKTRLLKFQVVYDRIES